MHKYDRQFTLWGGVPLREPKLTDFNAISARTAKYAERQLLAHAEPLSILNKLQGLKIYQTLSDKGTWPPGKPGTVKFRRPVPKRKRWWEIWK